jgi:hypothetical protein
LALTLPGRLDDLTDAELLEVATAARRQTSWAQSQELAAINELARRREQAEQDGDPDYRILGAFESVCQEVSAALTITGDSAATLVDLAGRLAEDLPETRQALEAGRIDLPRVRVIAELSHGLAPELCERLEERVLPAAGGKTTGQLRRQVRRIIQRLAPEQLQRRKREAIRDRRLEVWDTPTGTSDLAISGMDPGQAHAIFNKISAVARSLKADGDSRTLHQLRVDLAQQLLHGADLPHAVHALLVQQTATPAAEPHSGPGTSGEPPASDTVAGMPAEMTDRELDGIRSHLEVTGRTQALRFRITRAVQDLHDRLAPLRESWCRANGPTLGQGDGHGHEGYRPTAALRRMVLARHTTCAFPTCNRRSDGCDLDHTVPWGHGTTCQCNLAPLCRKHHRAKQTPGWELFQPWPGLLIWITPSGRWHITLPERE